MVMTLMIIIVSLTALNLERAVFDIMGGIRERTSNDLAYLILTLLTMGSVVLSVPFLRFYFLIIYRRWARRT